MCSTKSLLAGDGAIIAEIYKERVMKRGYGSGMCGWKTAYSDSPTGCCQFSSPLLGRRLPNSETEGAFCDAKLILNSQVPVRRIRAAVLARSSCGGAAL